MIPSAVIASYHIEVCVLYDLTYLQTQEIATIWSMEVSGCTVLYSFVKNA